MNSLAAWAGANAHDYLTHIGILTNYSYGAHTKHTGGYGTRRPGNSLHMLPARAAQRQNGGTRLPGI
jgi:hypothetical protein